MPHVLLLESDRIVAKCISEELSKQNYTVSTASNADRAVEICDDNRPDAVVAELSIPGHSGSEFLYEFRTYTDWLNIPIIIYSSLKPPKEVINSKDWKLLNIHQILYKPEVSIARLSQLIKTAIEV